jgi:hypothetical protein
VDQATLIIPDIHHKVELAERILAHHPGVPAIFMGDYFDDFHDSIADMETTCRWLQRKIREGRDTFLLGNHCFAYLSYELGVRWGYCSGWTIAKQQVFHQFFPGDALLKAGQWMVHCQGWLISHAGLTRKLRPSREIMDWVHDAESALTAGLMHHAFMAGVERGGPARYGGILWCDWNAFEPIQDLPQIVGHTPAREVRYKGNSICLDTHLHHYGLLENGELTVLGLD